MSVTDANGCTDADSVYVSLLPKLALNIPSQRFVCRGQPDTIGAEATGGTGNNYRYRWTPGAGLSSDTTARPVMLADSSRRYIVEVVNGSFCSTRDTMDIVVVDPPRAMAGIGRARCRDSSTGLGAPQENGVTYRWMPSDGLDDSTLAQPTAHPSRSTTYYLEVTDTATGCTSLDSVRVDVVRDALSTSVPSLDFGRLDGCTSIRERTILVRNEGEGDMVLTDTLAGSDFVVSSPPMPLRLATGDTVTIVVRYAPTGAGAHADTLRLVGDRCGIFATILVRGNKDASFARVGPSTLDFGSRLRCDTANADRVLRVYNLGSDPMTVSGVSTDAPFIATGLSAPVTIAPGDSEELRVLLPSTPGVFDGEGRIAYSAGTCRDTLRVLLHGEIVVPALDVPIAIDVGTIAGFETDVDTTLLLHNPTSLALTLASLTSGDGVRTATPLPATIPAGGDFLLDVRIAPGASGVFDYSALVHLTECDTTFPVRIVGEYRGVVFTTADTIDFGEVVLCGDSAVALPLNIAYSGGGKGSIALATFDAPFALDSIAGTKLDSGVTWSTPVHFAPTSDGAYEGHIRLHLDPCGVDRDIVVRGARQSIALIADPTVLDFGNVTPGSAPTGTVSFINTSAIPVTVETLAAIAPPFSLVTSAPRLPALLNSRETLTATIAYTAVAGLWMDTLEVGIAMPRTVTTGVELRAGTVGGVSPHLSLVNITAKPGEHERLTISTDHISDLNGAGVETAEATLRFASSLLHVEEHQIGVTTLADSGGWKRVRITGTVGANGAETGGINVVALLGRTDRTPIIIDDVQWLDGAGKPVPGIIASADTGRFVLDGVCRQGTGRFVDGLGEFFLRNVVPTPTRGVGTLEFGIVEEGDIHLEVIDMNGRRLGSLLNASPGPGVYNIVIDTRPLGAGVYVLVLRTPTSRREVRMVVARE